MNSVYFRLDVIWVVTKSGFFLALNGLLGQYSGCVIGDASPYHLSSL